MHLSGPALLTISKDLLLFRNMSVSIMDDGIGNNFGIFFEKEAEAFGTCWSDIIVTFKSEQQDF